MHTRCSYIFVEGIHIGKRYSNLAIIDKFCKRCYKRQLRDDNNPTLNEYCKPRNSDKFVEYFNSNSFTQGQLNTALKESLSFNFANPVTSIIFFSDKFFPDACGYDFLLFRETSPLCKSMLFMFFYKRFLIKSYILAQDLQLADCLARILDPCMITIDKPYFYTKVMLHDMLFHGCEFIDKSKLHFNPENRYFYQHFQSMEFYGNRSHLINGYYIMHEINGHYYFIGKDINDKIYDLHDDDILNILTVVSL